MLSISSKLPRLQADRETRLPVVHLDGLHSGFQLTVMHEGDAPATYDALRYTSVASMLSTAPEPYTLADAEHFHVRFRKPTTERVRAVSESVDWNTADEAAIRKALEQIGCDTLPLTAIRDGTTGRLVGSVAWRRNAWEQWTTADPARRAELLARNAALPRGHDDVTYSFGYWIHPDYAGRGLATAAVRTSLSLNAHFYNVRQVEGICRADNPASRRVIEKLGLTHVGQADMPWKSEQEAKAVLIFSGAVSASTPEATEGSRTRQDETTHCTLLLWQA